AAIAAAFAAVLKDLAGNRWTAPEEQESWAVEPLAEILDSTILSAEEAAIRNSQYLRAFGYPETTARAGELWRFLIQESLLSGELCDEKIEAPLRRILSQGTLSRRIVKALGSEPSHDRQREVYGWLCDCLAQGRLFEA
ncbi:MAG: hypothetical protein WC291_11135, partial [Thermodesulfovibrionales bacterium]